MTWMSLSQDLMVVGPLLEEEVVMMTRSGRRWGWDEVWHFSVSQVNNVKTNVVKTWGGH